MSAMQKTETVEQAVGRHLRDKRENFGLSVDDLSARSGVLPEMITAIERGRQRASMTTLISLCAALDLRLADLFQDFIDDGAL